MHGEVRRIGWAGHKPMGNEELEKYVRQDLGLDSSKYRVRISDWSLLNGQLYVRIGSSRLALKFISIFLRIKLVPLPCKRFLAPCSPPTSSAISCSQRIRPYISIREGIDANEFSIPIQRSALTNISSSFDIS